MFRGSCFVVGEADVADSCNRCPALASVGGVRVSVSNTTLGGGSLGSRVDEGRSEVRELMRIAEHIEHQFTKELERRYENSLCTLKIPKVKIEVDCRFKINHRGNERK